MASTRQRLGSAFAIVVAGATMFVVASSYLVSRDLPIWLAGAIGVLAFPAGPVVWHIVAERRRRKRIATAKQPSKSALSAIDRYWLRTAAAAIVVIGPMIAIGGFDVARAVLNHATWWVPTASSTAIPGDAAPLLSRIPAEAELVIIVRKNCVLEKPNGTVVAAWGNGQAAVVADPALADKDLDTEIASAVADRHYYPFLPFDGLDAVKLHDLVAFASSGWRSSVTNGGDGPNEDVRRMIARAPSDANLVVAFVPRTIAGVPVRDGAAWLRADKSTARMIAEARVEALDAAAATKLADDTRAALGSVDGVSANCRAKLHDMASAVVIEHDGAIVTARLELSPFDVPVVMACL